MAIRNFFDAMMPPPRPIKVGDLVTHMSHDIIGLVYEVFRCVEYSDLMLRIQWYDGITDKHDAKLSYWHDEIELVI